MVAAYRVDDEVPTVCGVFEQQRDCFRLVWGPVPLIVTDETRGRYYDSLASAARGDYEGLFSYFKDMQRDYLRKFAAILPDKTVRDEVGRHIEIRPGDVPRQGEFQGAVESLADRQRNVLSISRSDRAPEDRARHDLERG